jgi:hypothetical protein
VGQSLNEGQKEVSTRRQSYIRALKPLDFWTTVSLTTALSARQVDASDRRGRQCHCIGRHIVVTVTTFGSSRGTYQRTSRTDSAASIGAVIGGGLFPREYRTSRHGPICALTHCTVLDPPTLAAKPRERPVPPWHLSQHKPESQVESIAQQRLLVHAVESTGNIPNDSLVQAKPARTSAIAFHPSWSDFGIFSWPCLAPVTL